MKRSIALASAALLSACTWLTDPACGCSPPGGGTAVLTGRVLTPADAPAPGTTVKLRLARDVTDQTVESGTGGAVTAEGPGGFVTPRPGAAAASAFKLGWSRRREAAWRRTVSTSASTSWRGWSRTAWS